MKNSEVLSALIGGAFFAIPYLALSVPIIPSIAIGATAFGAGELVLKKNSKLSLKDSNISLYKQLQLAKSQNKHILNMIQKIDDESIKKSLKGINESITKIIQTIEKNPEKEKKIKNLFNYYLPVTIKLIDKFDEIENQNISSTNSKKYYETTSRTFNEINIVFKKFLNVLYESDMTDANVEIKVLNSMLKADGFDDSEINILRKEDSDE